MSQRCQFLQAKDPFISETDVDDRAFESSTAQFWCLRTMTPVGPDDHLVAPEECCSHRQCFKIEEF